MAHHHNSDDSHFAKIVLCGDVMLGRLVDKVFEVHNREDLDIQRRIQGGRCDGEEGGEQGGEEGGEESENGDLGKELKEAQHEEKYMQDFRKRAFGHTTPHHNYVWGNMLPFFNESDLRLINLETSVTTSDKKWPRKAFNYRMHPANLECLKLAKIDYVSLANNHSLDYSLPGLHETMSSLKKAGIPFAGVGNTKEEAMTPAIVTVKGVKMAIFSFADHYSYWASEKNSPGINFMDTEHVPKNFYKEFTEKINSLKKDQGVSLIMVSYHWGSNYSWHPPSSIVNCAHRLIDSGVDIIHGHSSHHVQGVEIYKKKVIIYGCGDFVDDYAVDDHYRNDLGFLYRVNLDTKSLEWISLELIPTKINKFQVNKAVGEEARWLAKTVSKLSVSFGTKCVVQSGEGGKGGGEHVEKVVVTV